MPIEHLLCCDHVRHLCKVSSRSNLEHREFLQEPQPPPGGDERRAAYGCAPGPLLSTFPCPIFWRVVQALSAMKTQAHRCFVRSDQLRSAPRRSDGRARTGQYFEDRIWLTVVGVTGHRGKVGDCFYQRRETACFQVVGDGVVRLHGFSQMDGGTSGLSGGWIGQRHLQAGCIGAHGRRVERHIPIRRGLPASAFRPREALEKPGRPRPAAGDSSTRCVPAPGWRCERGIRPPTARDGARGRGHSCGTSALREYRGAPRRSCK